MSGSSLVAEIPEMTTDQRVEAFRDLRAFHGWSNPEIVRAAENLRNELTAASVVPAADLYPPKPWWIRKREQKDAAKEARP